MKTYEEFLFDLNEAKQVGVIYHFTKPEYFDLMIDAAAQKKNVSSEIFALYGHTRGVSLTRNFSLSSSHFGDISIRNGYTVRIAIDGDSLSNKYKIRPVVGFDWNSNSHKDVLDVRNKVGRMSRVDGESEELVLPRAELVKLLPHIKAIDFHASPTREVPLGWYSEKVDLVRDMGIESDLMKVWRPYKL